MLLRKVSDLGGGISMLVGGTVLLGYLVRSDALKTFFLGPLQMNPVTAILFILAGISLLGVNHGKPRRIFFRAGLFFAVAIIVLMVLKLLTLILGWDVFLDRYLFANQLSGTIQWSRFPSRIALNTMFNFSCIGMALVCLYRPRREYWAQAFVLVALFVTFLTILGYVYGAEFLTGFSIYMPMVPGTALGFVVLGVGVLVSRSTEGMMAVLTSGDTGGILLRKLIPTAIIFPPVLGFLGLMSAQLSVLSRGLVFAMVAATTTIVFSFLLWIAALRLNDAGRQLRESYKDLEKKVEERTAALTRTLQESRDAQRATSNLFEDLKAEERALQLANSKYETLFQSIGDAVIATDRDGRIIVANKVSEKVLGFTCQEIMDSIAVDVLHLEDQDGEVIAEKYHPISLALRSEKATVGASFNVRRKSGEKIPVAITVTPALINSKVIGAVLIFRDIRKEKEIDKQKTEFVSLASHQLRGPLTAISWYAEMILHGDMGEVAPTQQKYLEEIYRGNSRMIELVDALLDVSRIELGTLSMVPKQTDILALARGILDEQNHAIQEKELSLITQFDEDIPTLLVDEKFLRIVLQNILVNAIKYTPKGGRIRIAITRKNAKSIKVEISDTGYGIPKEQMSKMFTKFFRADNVKNREIEGTGLGLYIAKSIVENSGGKIWFSSPAESPIGGETAENPGTAFYVTLPLTGARPKMKK